MSNNFYRPPPRTGGNAPTNALQASGEDRVIASAQSVVLTVGVGQGLTVNSSGSTVYGLPTKTIQTGASTVNISIQDAVVYVDAQQSGASVDLPDASTLNAGRQFVVKDTGSASTNPFTLGTRGGQIDGGASFEINESHAAICLMSDGSDYWIV